MLLSLCDTDEGVERGTNQMSSCNRMPIDIAHSLCKSIHGEHKCKQKQQQNMNRKCKSQGAG